MAELDRLGNSVQASQRGNRRKLQPRLCAHCITARLSAALQHSRRPAAAPPPAHAPRTAGGEKARPARPSGCRAIASASQELWGSCAGGGGGGG